MAADANLIKSAATAYGAGTAAKLAGGDPLGDLGKDLIRRVDIGTAEVKKRTAEAKKRAQILDDEFFKNQEKALQQSGALGEAEYEFTRRKVDRLQEEYQKCGLKDDACKKKVMMALSMESQGLTSMKDTRKLNAEALGNMRGDISKEQLQVMGIYANSQSGKYTIAEGEDGELRYTFDLGGDKEASYTQGELDKMFEAQKDNVGTEQTKQRALSNINRGKTGESFDEAQEGALYDNLTKTDNSLRSFLNDDWGVGTFAGSIDNKISAELEVLKSDPRIQSLDIPTGAGETNWYDNISKEDEALIKQRLMNPQTEEEMAISRQVGREYFIDAQRQQYNMGVREAERGMLDSRQKEINKIAFENLKQTHKLELQNAKSQDAIDKINAEAEVDAGKITIKESEQVDKAAPKIDIININYKEGDPDSGEQYLTNVSTDQMKAIDKNLKDPNVRGVPGNFGYYYKDAKGNWRKFDNKQDFAKKQKIKIKSGENLDDAIERYRQEGKYKPEVQGLRGGKVTSLETIRADEQLESAKDQVIKITTRSRTENITPIGEAIEKDFDPNDI